MKHSRGNTGTFRRVIKEASICLLLGAIVNVAVAWGFAWFTAVDSGRNEPLSRQGDDDYDGSIREVWAEYFPADRFDELVPPWLIATWVNDGLRFDMVFETGGVRGPVLSLKLVRSGFPMYCLSYHYWTDYSSGLDSSVRFDSRYALLWNQELPPGRVDDLLVALPLRPDWPAFAINTIFYGVILWVLLFMPFVIRRWRRIRRGLCIKCGYDLRGNPGGDSGCPECGWNRDQNVETSKHQKVKTEKCGVKQ